MRYRLRTLLILAGFAPPVLAVAERMQFRLRTKFGRRLMLRYPSLPIVVVAVVMCFGCGGSSKANLSLDLKRTGLAYHSFHDDHDKKGPAGWDELIAYARDTNNFPDSVERVRDAGYTMTWDVRFDDVKEPLSNLVLGKPPATGATLMLDGSVRE